MAYKRIIEAGHDVAEELAARKARDVRPGRVLGTLNSDDLCAFQLRVSRAGYIEAEIVESNYGFSVRYASGLQNFGLIFSAKARQTDGTLEGAIAAAKAWQAADPTHRFVSRSIG